MKPVSRHRRAWLLIASHASAERSLQITGFLRQMAASWEKAVPDPDFIVPPKEEFMTGAEVARFHPVRRKLSIDRTFLDADGNAWHDF